MARNLLPFDEINSLKEKLFVWHSTGHLKTKEGRAECIDALLDLLIMSYVLGNDAANEMLESDITVDVDEMEQTVYRKVEEKTFVDRVNEYADKETAVDDISRVIDTESHHSYNASSYNTAVKAGSKTKRWICTFVNSRDTHIYLHNTKLPIDAEFYTFAGNKAMYPGQFGVPEEDINCNCYLAFEK